jgi:hypothetical protein
MSIHNLTFQEFMQLDSATLELAIRLCDAEIKMLQGLALQRDPKSQDYEDTLRELATVLQLRKVHKCRLEELAEATETDGSTELTSSTHESR